MAEEFDDVPPLEDMSEMIEHVNVIRDLKGTSETKVKEHNTRTPHVQAGQRETNHNPVIPKKQQEVKVNKETETSSKSKENNSGGFAGMKKGFLFGGGTAKKMTQTTPKPANRTPADEIPFIKPKSTKEEDYRFPEVQQSISASQAFAQNKEWVTEDLLTRIMKNPKLAEKMANPSFISAVSEFQSNPTGAMAKYGDNPEMQSFLKEFSGTMGDHFSRLADQQERSKETTPGVVTQDPAPGADLRVRSSTNPHQMTGADEDRMNAILAMPEIRDILMDPRVQTLFETLRNKPDKARSALKEADPGLQKSIRKLIEVGLLQFET